MKHEYACADFDRSGANENELVQGVWQTMQKHKRLLDSSLQPGVTISKVRCSKRSGLGHHMGPLPCLQSCRWFASVQVHTPKTHSFPISVITLLALSGFGIAPPAIAQSCPVNTPHIQGVWRTLPYLMPINPISATLLHTGKVLIVAGSENDAPTIQRDRRATATPFGIQRIRLRTASRSRDRIRRLLQRHGCFTGRSGSGRSAEHRITHLRATTAPRSSIQLRTSSCSLRTW